MEQPFVTAVTHSDAEARVTLTGVRDEPGVAGRIFTALADANVNVDVIIQNEPVGDDQLADLSFTVDRADLTTADRHDRRARRRLARACRTDERIGKVSIVGAGMRSHPGVAAKVFEVLGERGDQHRDDLHLADQDLLRHLRRPGPRRGQGAARGVRAGRRRDPARGPDRPRPPAHGRRLSRPSSDDGGDGYRVGVLGATGLVGTTILELLAERGFPAAEVVPLRLRALGRQARSSGTARCSTCRALSEESIQGLDLVLSSAGGSVSAEWAPKLVEAGAVVVDNTSYWRMHDDVPLVVAEVNPDALDGHNGIVANPNCSTMQMVVALKPLYDAAGIERLVISTYQAVSGTGKAAIDELLAPVARGARRRRRRRPRSTRTRSPSTSSPRRAASPTATTTPTRSAS